jgi:hypothetical protein
MANMSPLLRILLPAFLFVSFVQVALAAKVDPPTIALSRSTTSIVIAEFKGQGPRDRLVFWKQKVLQSLEDVPKIIDLGKPDLQAPLEIGKRYVIAYSIYSVDQFERTTKSGRGGFFLASPGITPSLWAYSPKIEELVQWRIGNDAKEVKSALPRLLKMLDSKNRQIQDFAAAEIAYRPELVRTLGASSQRKLQKLVANEGASDVSRSLMLNWAVIMPANSRSESRWTRIALDILSVNRSEAREMAGRPALVFAALQYLRYKKFEVPESILIPWLASGDSGIAEAVLMSLHEVNPANEVPALNKALEDHDLSNDSRSFLLQYRDRVSKKSPLNQE